MEYEDGRNILYIDFPKSYVFKLETYTWQPRQRGFSIGRMYFVPPSAGERYYLRLLLTVIPGITSFTDLRIIDGVEYLTYKAACLATGLLEHDHRWISCFEDASVWQSGNSLRRLFVIALLEEDVTDPLLLWQQFADKICDDLPRRVAAMVGVPAELERPDLDYGLYLIDGLLVERNRSLRDFGLPPFRYEWSASQPNPLLARELSSDPDQQRELFQAIYSSFNERQALYFDEFKTLTETDPEQVHFFI